jgi:hypothetical protein
MELIKYLEYLERDDIFIWKISQNLSTSISIIS